MQCSYGRQPSWWILTAWCLAVFWLDLGNVCAHNFSLYSAIVTYTYNDSRTGQVVSVGGDIGRFGVASRVAGEQGWVVHVLTVDGGNHGCTAPVNVPSSGPWIALVKRGGCPFNQKVENSWLCNASAVVIYNHKDEDSLITMQHYQDSIVSVFIMKKDGEEMAKLVDAGVQVYMNISIGTRTMLNITQHNPDSSNVIPSNPPMIIILLTFLAVLIIALVALLVYAVRRAKYVHAKYHANMVFTLQENPQAQENLLNGDVHDTPENADQQESQVNR